MNQLTRNREINF